MRFQVWSCAPALASRAPYRLRDGQQGEVEWLNRFLDAAWVRGLSACSVRAYAFALLNFLRWWWPRTRRQFPALTDATLLAYVRWQRAQSPAPSAPTINHRLAVVRGVYRFHCGQAIPPGPVHVRRPYTTRSPLGVGRPRRALAHLSVRAPRRMVVPLSPEQVRQFWQSLRTFRDLGLTALLLFNGLRAQEALQLTLEDLLVAEAQLRVRGKGNRDRVLPLPPETLSLLQTYLRVERPLTNAPALFVVLKGPRRGQPLSPAGLRSLFRHHRRQSRMAPAHPHRFRHSFAADMVRAGIALPALMHLMGHAQIRTTMRYVHLAPQDVWREFTRVTQALRPRPVLPGPA